MRPLFLLLLSVAVRLTPLAAQTSGGGFACSAVAGPKIVRSEGLTELVSDVMLICSGGTPIAAGQQLPQANLTVSLNTTVTSRILASSQTGILTEALLLIDEPGAANPPVPQLVCGTQGTAETPPGSGVCTMTGTGNGIGVYSGTGARANIFQGQLTGSNQISWLGVPLDAPAQGATRILRFTNLRANASQTSSSPIIVSVSATVFFNGGSAPLTIANSTLAVASGQSGLAFAARTADNSANLNSPAILPTCTRTFGRIATLRFQETFASDFRPQTVASYIDANTSPPPADQNVPGQIYNSETGFRNSAFPSDSSHGNVNAAGLADFGTRLRAQFSNIPTGVNIAVEILNQGAGSGLAARLVTNEGTSFSPWPAPSPVSPVAVLSPVNGTATVVWEILAANPAALDTLDFGVYASYSGTGSSGTVTVQANLTPISTITSASATDPIPRFGSLSAPTNLFSLGLLNPCATLTVTPTPAPLSFSFAAGSTGPASGSLQIQASAQGLVATLFPYTYADGYWLSAASDSAALPATVSISVNPSGLSPGTYSGAFLVSGLGASNSILVPVTMIIGNGAQSTDRLYVGAMTLTSFQGFSSVPLPNAPNEKYCSPVRLAPDMLAWAYVPTPQERSGDFSTSPASSQLVDPVSGTPFPGGVIPLSRLPDPFAWRIAASGPAPGETCMPAPPLPQFTTSYYVTGRNTAADVLGVDRSTILGIMYQIGDPFPPDQVVNVFSKAPVDLFIGSPTSSSPIDPSRWLQIHPPTPCCTTPSTLNFSIHPTGVPPGSYAALVTITPLGAIGPQVSVNIGVFVQAPSSWITLDKNSLQFSFPPGQPGGAPAQTFTVTASPSRSYTLTPRVVSPAGVSWVGISATSGTGTATYGVFLNSAAAALAPGTYLAVIDVVAGTGILPHVSFAHDVTGGSGVVCGGGLTSGELIVIAHVGTDQITPASGPKFPLIKDSNFNLLVMSIPYTPGTALPAPSDLTLVFQPVVQGIATAAYDVKSGVLTPDPANQQTSGWLGVTPGSSRLPATVVPALNQTAVNGLGACDYWGYITVSNNGAGAVILVKFSVADTGIGGSGGGSPINVTKVMSQIADGDPLPGAWKTTIILVNTDLTNAAKFQLTFHPGNNHAGQPIDPNAPFNVVGPGQSGNRMYADTIPPGGSLTLETKGPGAPFWQGWAELVAPDSVGGTAIFTQGRDANNDSEGSVLLKPPAGTTFFLPFDNDNSKGLVTAMALVNTSPTFGANVTVNFHSEAGDVFAQGAVSLVPSGHAAFTLPQQFPAVANRRGVAEFISDGAALAALGLRFNGLQNSFTSFETLTPPGGELQAAAHIVDGGIGEGAWKTSITLVNLDATQSNNVTLTFHNGQRTAPGQVLLVEGGSLAGNGTYSTTLLPGGSTTIATQGLAGIPRWEGWADINSSTALGGFAVFRQSKNVGQIEGTVSFTPKAFERFVVPFGTDTGIALANSSDQTATISASFRDATGAGISAAAQAALPLLPGSHIAFGLEAADAPLGGARLAQRSGIADFTSNQAGLVGIGLRFTPRNAFTALPIILK
jgi:hypothetical protein